MARKAATKKTISTPAPQSRQPRAYVPPASRPFNADALADHSDMIRSAEHLRPLALPPASTPQPRNTSTIRVLCVMPEVEPTYKVADEFEETDGPQYTFENQQLKRRQRLAEKQLQHRFANHLEQSTGIAVDLVPTDNDVEDDGLYVAMPDKQPNRRAIVTNYDIIFVDADYRTGKLSRAVADALSSVSPERIYYVDNVLKANKQTVPQTLSALVAVVQAEIARRAAQVPMPWAAPLPTLPAVDEDDAAVDAAILKWARR